MPCVNKCILRIILHREQVVMGTKRKRREKLIDMHTTINYPDAPRWAYLCQWSVTLPAMALLPLILWVAKDSDSLSRTIIHVAEFRWTTSIWSLTAAGLFVLLLMMRKYYNHVIKEKDDRIADLKDFILTLQGGAGEEELK